VTGMWRYGPKTTLPWQQQSFTQHTVYFTLKGEVKAKAQCKVSCLILNLAWRSGAIVW